MIPTFIEWMKLMDESQEISKGWSKKTAVPVGAKKDIHPDHPKNAIDPEKHNKKEKKSGTRKGIIT